MSKVYEEAPNVVKITMTDKSGSAERHIVGYTLDEIIETVTLSLDGAEAVPSKPTKSHRKPRRTKAEMAAASGEEKGDGIERRDTVPTGNEKAWP